MTAPNSKFWVGDKTDLWNKIMTEVGAKRYAGPYLTIPYQYYIQSPVGLVPKDQGRKTRLIFHLSYPRCTGTSVNANIPQEWCRVTYPDFDLAVRMCINEGKNCRIGKSDFSMAFRHVPLKIQEFPLMVLKAYHPVTDKLYFLGGLSLHLNHLIAERMSAHYWQFGTLPIGIFLSNLVSGQLETSLMTSYCHF